MSANKRTSEAQSKPAGEAQAQVQLAIDAAVAHGTEIGVQVAAYLDGVQVVDAWGGVADPATGRKVDGETLFNVYSVTKAVAATALHIQVDRGLLDYNAPVARYWPSGLKATASTCRGDCETVLTRAPFSTFQSRTVESSPPLASNFPSGLNSSSTIASEWPVNVLTNSPVSGRHIFTVLSKLPLASHLLSGLNATLQTLRACPVNVRARVPSGACQMLMVLSAPELASHFPSGLKATLHTASECPGNVFCNAPSLTRQSRTNLS